MQFHSIEHLDVKEIWSAANASGNESLQRLCIPRIVECFDQFSVDKDLLGLTNLEALRLLLKSEELSSPSNTKPKVISILNWVTSAGSDEEKVKRKGHFEELLELLDLSTLPESFIEDITRDRLEFNIPNNCK